MITTNPWINFNGNAEEAFTFYKSVLGGEFGKIVHSEDESDKIMQIILSLSNGQMIIGNDVPGFLGKVSEEENRSKIHVGVESKEEVERIFNGLSAGGQAEMPMGDSPWGTSFAMFRDKYGIEWVIEFNPNK